MAGGLPEQDVKTLRLIADTLVPFVAAAEDLEGFYARKASDLNVDRALAELVGEYLGPETRRQFRLLLKVFESRVYNLLLSGKPVRFSSLPPGKREAYLLSWANSRLGLKRTGFQGLKRMTLFLFYAMADANGHNPNWKVIGYPTPDRRRLPAPPLHPPEKKIKPLQPEQDLKLACDVVVIGAGAGGSVIASTLAKAGRRVVVVEAGGYRTADDFDQQELSMMEKSYAERGTLTSKDLSFILLAGTGAGGGTTVNWCTCLKPPVAVLREWEDVYGVQDVTSPEFQGYVDEVWKALKVNTAESQRNPNNDVLWRGCKALGYTEGVDFELISRNAVGCSSRCMYCPYGCAYSAKQSTILNYLPEAYLRGAQFLFNTEVDYIVIRDGTATGIEATHTRNGKTLGIHVDAKIVVAAAGAVYTPALLLKSSVKSRTVGSNLKLHPTTAVAAYYDSPIEMWNGPMQTVAVTKFRNLDGKGHGFWIEAAPGHPGLIALSLPWEGGKAHKDLMAQASRAAATIVLIQEAGSGRVTIDKQGEPVVDYELAETDKKHIIQGLEEAARIHLAAGAKEIISLHVMPARIKSGSSLSIAANLEEFSSQLRHLGVHRNRINIYSAHLMASCPMGTDPKTSATNSQGELHAVKNLFIGDASVFPTSPGVNPMITIMAMARRIAEFINQRL